MDSSSGFVLFLLVALVQGIRGQMEPDCDVICDFLDMKCSSSQDRSCGVDPLSCKCSTKTWIIVVSAVVGFVVIACIVGVSVLACYCGGVCCFRKHPNVSSPSVAKPSEATFNETAVGSPVDVEEAPAVAPSAQQTLD